MRYQFLLAALAALSSPAALGVIVTTTGNDGFGTSSFNSAGVWSNALAPSAGNDYFIDDEDRVRTPADGGSYAFGGDSLTVQAIGSGGDLNIKGLSYKGTGNTGTITVDNLILDGGSINHINGSGDVFNLDGSISVTADSIIYAKQGPINILSLLSGSASITNPGADGTASILTFGSTTSTFDGNLVNNGRFTLADNALYNFTIGASGVSNSISGTGAATFLDGDFVFDLSGASSTFGDSWDLVSAANTSFGANFTVSGFSDNGNDTWSSGDYLFSESTGSLVVVPEPSAALLGALGLLGLLRRRK